MGKAGLIYILSTSVTYNVQVDKKSEQRESYALKNPEECMITEGIYNYECAGKTVGLLRPGSRCQCVHCTGGRLVIVTGSLCTSDRKSVV